MLVGLSVISCKPVRVDPIMEIKSNETAFVVPLESGTAEQAKFESVDFLQSQQIAAKRVVIPQRQRDIGRMPWSIEWIPTVKVVTVDRTPVSRSWTESPVEGKNISNSISTFGVESSDSIGFQVGINVSAFVDERDAAKYLYYYRGTDLDRVMDSNVRERVHTILSREFGGRTLQECKANKNFIIDALKKDVEEYFKVYGITITSIGLAEGLTYEQKEIQDAINKTYIAEMSVEQQKQENRKQEELNKQLLLKAQGEKAQAEEFAKAAEERQKLVTLEIQKIKAEALLEGIKKWDGQMPKFISGNSGSEFLFQLDSK